MSVDPAAANLVAARLGEPGLAETCEQRAYHHDRAPQARTLLHEFGAGYIIFIDMGCRETVFALGMAVNFHAHPLQEGDQVAYVKNIRNIGYCNCFGGKQHGAYNLQGLVLRPLGSDAATQAVAAFYDK